MNAGLVERYLRRALSLAARGGRATAPNPRVGAVIVAGDVVVGEGWHERAGGPHAELLAIQQAGASARGATLFSSLEPCSHRGRTPPCTAAIIDAGIRCVRVPLIDPDPRVQGRGLEQLRRAGLDVELVGGELAADAERTVEEYMTHRRAGRAFAVLKAATTLDGRTADRDRHSRWITGQAAQSHGRSLRDRYGAIVVGVGTVISDDPRLLPPSPPPEGGPFVRAVLDPRLRTPTTAALFADVGTCPLVIYGLTGADAERRSALERAGAEVVLIGHPMRPLPPETILRDLASRSVLGVVIEGGGVTHGHFLRAGLIDKVYWYLAPRALADPGALPAIDAGPRRLSESWRLSIANVVRLGDDVLLTLYPRGASGGCSPES